MASTTTAITPPVSLDEILTFECAKHVINIVPEQRQLGPVFHREGLTFTSINAINGEKILIVNAGSGTFSIPLVAAGVNRVRFTLPSRIQADMVSYYISYLHGGSRNSRFFEFSAGKAPTGKDEIDYTSVIPRRANNLLAHFEYAIFETIENTLTMITDHRIDRAEVGVLKAESCDHISRNSPTLAKNMRYDLDVIAALIKPPPPRPLKPSISIAKNSAPVGGRGPASVASNLGSK